MRKHLATVCLLLAWLCANGAVSDLAQVFAWTRMFSGYARVLSISEALTETFAAGKPCELCIAVKKTRASEDALPRTAALSSEKLLLACSAASSPAVFAPPVEDWPSGPDWLATARTERVRLRPPRV